MKKILKLLRKRNNKGFTLVEVIVSCALLGILILGMAFFATPIFDLIKDTQKDARATMLAESLNSYIYGLLKNAKYVAVFENVGPDDLASNGASLVSAAPDDETGIAKINSIVSSAPTKYQVCCLAVKWLPDEKTGKSKLMLENQIIGDDLKILSSSQVFTDIMYDGLYPIITFETFGPLEETTSGEYVRVADSDNAKGYKLTTMVYSDQNCYSVQEATRTTRARLSFTGVSFVQCVNMNQPADDPIQVRTTQQQIDAKYGTYGYSEDGANFYYPDTYVYYVVPIAQRGA